MKITTEQRLRYFDFWGGAKERASLLTYEELDIIEMELEMAYYPEGIDETKLNDIFGLMMSTLRKCWGMNHLTT